jgi:hypothetical protein
MPPKRSITLTEAELRLMKLLWVRGESAVADSGGGAAGGGAAGLYVGVDDGEDSGEEGVCGASPGGPGVSV